MQPPGQPAGAVTVANDSSSQSYPHHHGCLSATVKDGHSNSTTAHAFPPVAAAANTAPVSVAALPTPFAYFAAAANPTVTTATTATSLSTTTTSVAGSFESAAAAAAAVAARCPAPAASLPLFPPPTVSSSAGLLSTASAPLPLGCLPKLSDRNNYPAKNINSAGVSGAIGSANHKSSTSSHTSNGILGDLPPIFQNRKLRSGKWLPEEEEYADALIQLFEQGHLTDCENGTTLRAYLSGKLHCAPMRISKKYAGTGIGKLVFLSKAHLLVPFPIAAASSTINTSTTAAAAAAAAEPSTTSSTTITATVSDAEKSSSGTAAAAAATSAVTTNKAKATHPSKTQGLREKVIQLEKEFYKSIYVSDELLQVRCQSQ